MKKSFYKLICLAVALSVLMATVLVGCTEETGGGSGGQSANQSGDESRSFSDAFEYSYSPADTTKHTERPPQQAINEHPLFYAMYDMAESDFSYLGTDAGVGFYSRLIRTEDTFETVPIGYGAGTTGGRGATAENTYVCTTRAEIISALDAIKNKLVLNPDLKSILLINGTIDEDTTVSDGYQVIVSGVKNVSFLGLENATLDGLGLNFKSVDNVIVQNVTIHHPNKSKKQEKDCLEFNNCNYVWVDHCELYNDYPDDSAEKDYYDGLIDIKNDSAHVTVSYTYMHDAWKTSLIGSGPDDVFATRTVTFHHNIFENCNSRQPMVRGGRLHVYNNLYINVLNRGTDCRYGATAFVENNVYSNCKKPVGWFEEPQGYYNLSGNIFDDDCKEVPKSPTCDFTPSYEYILDESADVEAFVKKHVGVNKIDIDVAKTYQAQEEYVVEEYKILQRSIEEIGAVTLSNECLQKLLYCAKQVLFEDKSVTEKVTNLDVLSQKIDAYFTLYAADIDEKINKIDRTGAFDVNCKKAFDLSGIVGVLNEYASEKLKNAARLNGLTLYYIENFATLFNAQLDTLSKPSASDMPTIENLLELYYRGNEYAVAGVDFDRLKQAYIDCNNLIKVSDFTALVAALPDADKVKTSDKEAVADAKKAYESLTEHQLYMVENSVKSRYTSIIDAFDKILNASKRMDLSAVNAGRTSAVTQVGDIYVGVSTDIRAGLSVVNGQTTYDKAVFLSGYGNTGSKCLQFSVFAPSGITIVVASEGGACKFLITDENKNVIKTFDTTGDGLQTVTVTDLPAGEYRLFTDIPSGKYTSAKAFIYEFTINPQ